MALIDDFNQTQDKSMQRIDDIFDLAREFRDRALSDIDTLVAAATAHISLLDGEAFAPSYDGLDLSYDKYSAPEEPDYSDLAPTDPEFDTPKTLDDLSHVDTPYTGLIKNEMQANFINVLGGSLIVPTVVWEDVFQRALEKVMTLKAAQEWEAQNMGASLGWELPAESTLAGLEQAQEQGLQAAIALIVEKAIAEAKERHADVWHAMEKGTPFEGMWMGDHHKAEDRKLEAAKQHILLAIAANDQMLRSDDIKLRQWAMKWETPLKAIAAGTDRLNARARVSALAIESETARRGYEALKLDKGLKEEAGKTDLAVQKAELAKVLVDSLTQIANLMAAMAQGALAASDVSVGTSASYGYSYSDNYSY